MAAHPAYLLDTHIAYWWMTDNPKLGKDARRLISRADASVSVASIWEMAIKNRKGKLPLPSGSVAESLESAGFRVRPILAGHVEATRLIAPLHNDPFDRLLLAVAIHEGMQLLTIDLALIEFARRNDLTCVKSMA